MFGICFKKFGRAETTRNFHEATISWSLVAATPSDRGDTRHLFVVPALIHSSSSCTLSCPVSLWALEPYLL